MSISIQWRRLDSLVLFVFIIILRCGRVQCCCWCLWLQCQLSEYRGILWLCLYDRIYRRWKNVYGWEQSNINKLCWSFLFLSTFVVVVVKPKFLMTMKGTRPWKKCSVFIHKIDFLARSLCCNLSQVRISFRANLELGIKNLNGYWMNVTCATDIYGTIKQTINRSTPKKKQTKKTINKIEAKISQVGSRLWTGCQACISFLPGHWHSGRKSILDSNMYLWRNIILGYSRRTQYFPYTRNICIGYSGIRAPFIIVREFSWKYPTHLRPFGKTILWKCKSKT